MINKIIKLINVKSIVTIALTGIFSFMCITGKVSSEQFQMIFTTVIAFYFGTQHEKTADRSIKNIQNNMELL